MACLSCAELRVTGAAAVEGAPAAATTATPTATPAATTKPGK